MKKLVASTGFFHLGEREAFVGRLLRLLKGLCRSSFVWAFNPTCVFVTSLFFLSMGGALATKPLPAYNFHGEFPIQGVALGKPVDVTLVFGYAKNWDHAEITISKISSKRIEGAAKDQQAIEFIERLSVDRVGGGNSTAKLPITVHANGEYTLGLTLDFYAGKIRTAQFREEVAAFAQARKVWVGAAITFAAREMLKNQLGIKGEPTGSEASRLDQDWLEWVREQQKRERIENEVKASRGLITK